MRNVLEKHHIGKFRSPAMFSHYHRWITFCFGYVVCLDGSSLWTMNIGNNHSEKFLFILKSSSPFFKSTWFYSNLGRCNYWIILVLRYIVHGFNFYIWIVVLKI